MSGFFFASLVGISEQAEDYALLFASYEVDEPDMGDVKGLPTSFIRGDGTQEGSDVFDVDQNELLIDYMIHKLCKNDPTKKFWIAENMNQVDYAEMMAFEKFDSYREKMYHKKLNPAK